MTLWNNKAFTENELSRLGKIVAIFLFVIPSLLVTVQGIVEGEINHPYAFSISIIGLILFLISKLSLFIKGIWISFGTRKLSENMANLYRLGYWFMAAGLVLTFFK